MASLTRLVLDVLKPHQPSGLEFTRQLAELQPGYRVKYEVVEVDEKTESVVITIEAENIDFEQFNDAISRLGGSLHSVDEVEFNNP
ncbi:MAG: DUF211 domain-containing protein [Gammaproteobacteria bacterium]|nr:DUF211 domain-containing protein [Gammaproteobacteria bacterium]MDH5730529.1 DUF211 domain-containing protein [Gammaproteobacteria bacterium]